MLISLPPQLANIQRISVKNLEAKYWDLIPKIELTKKASVLADQACVWADLRVNFELVSCLVLLHFLLGFGAQEVKS